MFRAHPIEPGDGGCHAGTKWKTGKGERSLPADIVTSPAVRTRDPAGQLVKLAPLLLKNNSYYFILPQPIWLNPQEQSLQICVKPECDLTEYEEKEKPDNVGGGELGLDWARSVFGGFHQGCHSHHNGTAIPESSDPTKRNHCESTWLLLKY
ncbi:hypothetical protein J6590_065833 [Homalodisca vitripennis]|nr:hypothetical protein J6590_065833 [Homalodisca vitripennis]